MTPYDDPRTVTECTPVIAVALAESATVAVVTPFDVCTLVTALVRPSARSSTVTPTTPTKPPSRVTDAVNSTVPDCAIVALVVLKASAIVFGPSASVGESLPHAETERRDSTAREAPARAKVRVICDLDC